MLARMETRWKVVIGCALVVVVIVVGTFFYRRQQLDRLEAQKAALKEAEARYKEVADLADEETAVKTELGNLWSQTFWILRVRSSPEESVTPPHTDLPEPRWVPEEDYMPALLENLDGLARRVGVEIRAISPKAYERRKVKEKPKAEDPSDAAQREAAEKKFQKLPEDEKAAILADESYIEKQKQLTEVSRQIVIKLEVHGRLTRIYRFIAGLAYDVGRERWRFPQIVAIRNITVVRPAKIREEETLADPSLDVTVDVLFFSLKPMKFGSERGVRETGAQPQANVPADRSPGDRAGSGRVPPGRSEAS